MTTAPEPRDVLAVAMRYLRHRDGCAFHRQAECNCGLTDVIAAIREPAAAHPTPPPPLDAREVIEALPPACEPSYQPVSANEMNVCRIHGEIYVNGRCEDWDRGVRDAVLARLSPAATPSPDAGEPRTLDDAWREARKALRTKPGGSPYLTVVADLMGWVIAQGKNSNGRWEGTGDTATEALRALRDALESPESGT